MVERVGGFPTAAGCLDLKGGCGGLLARMKSTASLIVLTPWGRRAASARGPGCLFRGFSSFVSRRSVPSTLIRGL
jgi:hypothetical protein